MDNEITSVSVPDDDAKSLVDFVVDDSLPIETIPIPKPEASLSKKERKRAAEIAFVNENKSLIIEGKRTRRAPKTAVDTLNEYKAKISELESDISDAKSELATAKASGDKDEVAVLTEAILVYTEKLALNKYKVRDMIESSELYARDIDVDMGKLTEQLKNAEELYNQLKVDIETVPSLPDSAVNAMKKQRQTLFRKITKLQDTINAYAEDSGMADDDGLEIEKDDTAVAADEENEYDSDGDDDDAGVDDDDEEDRGDEDEDDYDENEEDDDDDDDDEEEEDDDDEEEEEEEEEDD
jgi:hypothetical protein